MNAIMQMNMLAVMNQKPAPPKFERGVRLHDYSRSKNIILYLFEHGKSTGSDIMQAIGITNSPKAYIQPHIKAGRVVCQVVHQHKSLYAIADGLTKADFGMKE